jgi:hypothetical protein
MHRSALAFAEAACLAEDLAKSPVKRGAESEYGTVATVRTGHRVTRLKRGRDTNVDRFLSLAKVGGPAHEVAGEELHDPVLEGTDLGHLLV